MMFSVTEVQSFKRCRRQWNYGSFNGQALTPIIQPKPYLDLGSMVHKALAYWTEKHQSEPDTPINLRHVFLTIASQQQQTVIARYTQATGHAPSDEEMGPLLDAIPLGAAMMENYQDYYKEPLPKHLRFCIPEQEIIIPIPGTEHPCPDCNTLVQGMMYSEGTPALVPCTTCNGTGMVFHHLKARLDALAQDKRSNIYIVERKTYDKRPDLLLLEASDQFIGYVWTAQQLDLGSVVGIAYDGLFKRAAPSSRSVAKTIDDLFVRTIITPAQDEVDEYGRELAETVTDMANNPHIYKNRQWQGCWDCSFEQLCRAQSQGSDIEFIIRTQYMSRTEDDTADIVASVDAHPLMTGA